MSARLDRVTDWKAIAIKCGFNLGKMAEALKVCERTLRRRLQQEFGITAKEWRDAERLEMALGSLFAGGQVKTASGDTGFKHSQAFSAFVKRQTGSSPRDFRHRY